MKRERVLIFIICAAMFCGALFLFWQRGTMGGDAKELTKASVSESDDATPQEAHPTEASSQKEQAVYISGAVKNPGLYRYQGEARLADAIGALGGFKKNAAKAQLNLAEILKDGEHIHVPTAKEAKKKSSKDSKGMQSDTTDSRESGKINLNTASKDELMTLPGIGESKAQWILDYREQQGSFRKVEDIMNISGIKEGIYHKIKDNITI